MATTICGNALLICLAAAASAQTFEVKPQTVKQGETIRVEGTGPAVSARMNGRTVRLFDQGGGRRLGLMPVSANDNPGQYPFELLAKDGKVLRTQPITVRDAHFRRQNIVLSKQTAELKATDDEGKRVGAFRKTLTEKRLWTEPLALPVAGCMSSPFGVKRYLNGKPTGDYHGGLDQRAPMATPVRAVADGTVRLTGMFNLRGGTVGVDHGQGLQTMYLHLSKFAVAEGAAVKRGDVIGYSGSTGRSNAPHLHWAIYVNEVTVNPLQWVSVKPCAAAGHRRGAATRRRHIRP